MYLLLIALLELHTLTRIPLDLSFSSLVCLSLLSLYSLWYFDGKEYTGERRWEAFRRLPLWRWISPVDVIIPANSDLQNINGKRLFVFTPCHTPSALIWSVGLHSGGVQFNHTTHYVLPPIFMWIPLVRDVLMWSGAVTYSMHDARHTRDAVILELLDQGRAVCFAPSNFVTHTAPKDLESNIEARLPSSALLEECIKRLVHIVPVVVKYEHERYRIVSNARLGAVQSFWHRYLDYPFPLCYWYRFYSHIRPPLLSVQFSCVMVSNLYGGLEELKNALRGKVDHVNAPIFPNDAKDTKNV